MNIYRVARLKEKKHRKESGQFLVEGDKAVLETVAAHGTESPYTGVVWEVVHVYGTPDFMSKHLEKMSTKKIPTSVVDAGELAKAGSMEVQSGAIAVVRIPTAAASQESIFQNSPLISSLTLGQIILAIDGVKDPGNLGTILRTADWFGVTTLLCGTDTVDVYNPKCIAATMGSFLRVRCVQIELADSLLDAKNAGARVYATAMRGTSLEAFAARHRSAGPGAIPSIVVMGSESHGVKPKLLAMADEIITIPRVGSAESLNVGVATGIILSHIVY